MSHDFKSKIWEENTWTNQARKLLRGLSEYPSQSKITVILRHSQRYEPKLVNESDLKDANMELTPLGEEVAAKFGENIINFAKNIPESSLTRSLISQLVRAGTSVGANYCEADDASTRKDFLYKAGICRRESKESKHWLRMLITAVPSLEDKARTLIGESQELNLIFSAIINTVKKK